MRNLALFCTLTWLAAACGGDDTSTPLDAAIPDAGSIDAMPDAGGPTPDASCTPTQPATIGDGGVQCGTALSSSIQHVLLLVQENHSFDTYFGKYCAAATGSNPACTTGPSCCEKGPATEPGGASPVVLTDVTNANWDPDHHQSCELQEINGGKMDQFAAGSTCSSPKNFAYAEPTGPIMPYLTMAAGGALGDHYFQPAVGQTLSNDMYFARARFTVLDNTLVAPGIGSSCGLDLTVPRATFNDSTIADLLLSCGKGFTSYAGGYDDMVTAVGMGKCPSAPTECPFNFLSTYPCTYDLQDQPWAFYESLRDKPATVKDLTMLHADVVANQLPAFSYVKTAGFRSEHPGAGTKLSDGVTAAQAIINEILNSTTYKDNTLILLTWDEGGGYFDHMAPPALSRVDCQPYGTRVPILALGHFAKSNYISHVVMEHSSIVKFIEWNWLGGRTGQLGGRDAVVNNIGDLLDASKTGTAVPMN